MHEYSSIQFHGIKCEQLWSQTQFYWRDISSTAGQNLSIGSSLDSPSSVSQKNSPQIALLLFTCRSWGPEVTPVHLWDTFSAAMSFKSLFNTPSSQPSLWHCPRFLSPITAKPIYPGNTELSPGPGHHTALPLPLPSLYLFPIVSPSGQGSVFCCKGTKHFDSAIYIRKKTPLSLMDIIAVLLICLKKTFQL